MDVDLPLSSMEETDMYCGVGKVVKSVNSVGFSHEGASEQSYFSTCGEHVYYFPGDKLTV